MSTATKQGEIIPIAPAQNAALTPMDMLNQAVERGANIDVLEKLMGLQERWEKNLARKAFDAAVADAKAELKPVVRNRQGHNGRYADFATIAASVDSIITKHGLSYRFRASQDERIHVTCVLSHRDGHSEENTLSGPPDASGNKNAIQAIGSTLMYLQRYSFMQALGLSVANDDDGKGASAATGPISDTQLVELQKKISAVGANVERFCAIYKIETPSDLSASLFAEAISRLDNYGRGKK